MKKELFNLFNSQIKKEFCDQLTFEDYERFVNYRAKGIEQNEVTCRFNYINFYAYSKGMTTKEANNFRYAKYRKDHNICV